MSFYLIKDGKALLEGIEFFEPFTGDELDALLKFAQVKKYHLQDLVITEKSEGFAFFVVIEGAAKVVHGLTPEEARTTHGHDHELAMITEGDCFGEMALLLGEKRTATVVAGVGCVVFEIEGSGIDSLNDSIQKKIYKQFAINLARRLSLSSIKK